MNHHKYTNALARETSPYLLQHAHNPVQWYPWGEEALSRARREDKPILLSIGYSACHWCHVMERESFEDEEIARLMNAHFINIKVDREERPDLDAIYMAVVQMATGGGGWPMTVFLTPDQTPFFCGTYFPPDAKAARPGFRQIVQEIARAYRDRKQDLYASGEAIRQKLQKLSRMPRAEGAIDPAVLDDAVAPMISNYDPQYGGFGRAPKFPPSMALSFLMRTYARTGREPLLEIVRNTLVHMANGGIYDHLGGGFHRYTLDAGWRVPHFEKMLYDNALLGRVYVDAYLLTGVGLFRRIARETLDYVLREMTSPEGGFYASQDADSGGVEGALYLWSSEEVRSILGGEEGEIFCRYFGITPGGDLDGLNILHIPRPGDAVATICGVTEERLLEVVRAGRRKLFLARERRVKPGRDEKILTAWNGLMLRTMAEAAGALGEEAYRRAALRNAEFVLTRLRDNGRLLRSYKDGQARFGAVLEDYAYLIDGLLALYEASFDSRWIAEAEALADRMVREFWDSDGDGFYFTAEHHEALIHRPKEFYDSATPSGNSAAAHALLRLGKFTGDPRWERYPVALFQRVLDLLRRQPAAFAHMLCAVDFHLGRPKEIAVAGNPRSADARALLDVVFRAYMPNKVVACGTEPDVFLLEGKPQAEHRATAYVCEDRTCRPPVTSADELRTALSPGPRRRGPGDPP